jgi:hypothetical protein
MTLRQSETLLRAVVALALGFGFVGFATQSHSVAPSTHVAISAPVETAAVAATPVAHAGI